MLLDGNAGANAQFRFSFWDLPSAPRLLAPIVSEVLEPIPRTDLVLPRRQAPNPANSDGGYHGLPTRGASANMEELPNKVSALLQVLVGNDHVDDRRESGPRVPVSLGPQPNT